MSLKFNVIEKGQPGVEGGGQKKFYAHLVFDGEVTADDLVKDIEKFSALSEPDIKGVISALENEIQNKLADGKIVRLEKLGSLYPSISSNGEEKPEKVNSRSIRKVGVNFRAGTRIIKALEEAGYKKEA